ncbi:unnamed protein product [Phyllotreta striolata]|uniref:Carboxylic ester hydrolase n=1 Tax=Phyllotreta striolata TaxID=444603 RepID=A0A9P0GL33_PHYSR|nr:unnamed protein product [Phyllotreta striolata]
MCKPHDFKMSRYSVLFVLLFHFNVIFCLDDDGPIIQLEKGKIQGIIRKSESGNNYYAFQEIPYAAPPVGANRYQLIKEPEPWEGILPTKKNTKICYQVTSRHKDLEISEDCLYMNIYSPDISGKKLLPVLLWVHGGGFTAESSTFEYSGPKYIMDHGVVVVTFNYRLGPFGFIGTDDGVIPLNLGLKDQRFAIEWVSKNVHLFGGDPKQVTLVGESAGSVAVGYHMISQKPEEDLFRAAIMQSGTPASALLKQSDSTENAFKLGRKINKGFTSDNTTELLQLLQNAKAEDILATSITGAVSVEKEGLFSHLGYQAFIDKKYKKIPVLIGFNSEEWLFLAEYENKTLMKSIDNDPTLLIPSRVNIHNDMKPKLGEFIKEIYTNNQSFENYYGGYIRYSTDELFIMGTCKQVELSCEDTPYYLYQFAYKGKLGGSIDLIPPPGAERVAHAEDLHYFWDDTTNEDLSKFPLEDQLMLHRYTKMWTNFIKYSNPTPEKDPLLQNFTWLPSEPNTLRYMNINSTFEMLQHPKKYKEIKQELEKYILPPFDSYW